MAEHNDLGRFGENLAERYLIEKGYKIAEHDWKLGHSDIDIIAWDKNELVFVEVKTRNSEEYAAPEDWVDADKQKTYVRLADCYVKKNNVEEEVRFDIIGIVVKDQQHELHHIVRAFDAASAKAARNTKGIATPKPLGAGKRFRE